MTAEQVKGMWAVAIAAGLIGASVLVGGGEVVRWVEVVQDARYLPPLVREAVGMPASYDESRDGLARQVEVQDLEGPSSDETWPGSPWGR